MMATIINAGLSPVSHARTLKLSPFVRELRAADMTAVPSDDGDVFEFPFSSEAPVERWFGTEILSHDQSAVDLSRMNDGAAVLWNHDRDCQIGVVEGARIGADRRAYARVRMGQSQKAREIAADVKAGVIRNVSTGYRINRMTEDLADGKSTFTATQWQPYEVSFVSVPADPSVGMGRDDGKDARDVMIETRAEPAPVPAKEPEMTAAATVPAAPAVDETTIRADAISAERARISSIEALGRQFDKGDLARSLIDSGKSIEEARTAVLEALGAKQVPVSTAKSGDIDMSEKEQRSYSVVRAINAAISGDWSQAGLEREASVELAKRMNRETTGFFMPTNLRMEVPSDSERAAYNVGTAGQGGNLVATNLLASSFIEVLRNKAMVMQLGPTLLSGLVGNVAIPRQITQTATYWVSEGSAVTEAEATFDQVTMSPKQLGALSEYSRLALQQTTPDIEAVVRNDLARVMALGLDLGVISGSGSAGQPTGILNTSGIGSVAMGTNGGTFAASSTTAGTGFDQLIDLEGKVAVANALSGSLSYLTNAKVINVLKKVKDQYGLPLWATNRDSPVAEGTMGTLSGYRAAMSNQVPWNLTKGTSSGVCSALIFGDFSQVLIGMWGGLEILPNPYDSTAYTKGAVRIRAMQTCDVALRHKESFAAITDITTTL